MKSSRVLLISFILVFFILGAALSNASPAKRWSEIDNSIQIDFSLKNKVTQTNKALAVGDPVDFDAALNSGAGYLQTMQADITEDNADNGTDGVDESPDDPDDGGWDWSTTTFSHSTSASPTNIYGATALGLYYAYLEIGGAGYFTAITDAANHMKTDPTIDSGSDLVFLMLYNDLPGVSGTSYADAARVKYDSKIIAYTTATGLAEGIRDLRFGQGYSNGIIPWDVGVWVRSAAMLDTRYPGNGYDTDSDDMAEVLWQDTYNSSPGYFDLIANAGFDPTYVNTDYYWYNLGLTGLIDAFEYSNTHTVELPALVTRLLESQFSEGGISFGYGVNPADDDWQSTAYAMATLANYDQATYQDELNRMGYWLGATQDVSGGWVYGSGNHYPEIGGECTAGLYFTTNLVSDVVADGGFTSQADVDVYNTTHGTSYIWGYTAFATIQAAIDAVNGSTVNIAPGTFAETITIDKTLTLLGSGVTQTFITGGMILAAGVTDVTVQHVYFTGVGASSSIIRAMGDNINFTLDNCVLDGEGIGGRFGYSGGSMVGDVTITNNEMKNVANWSLFDSRSGSGGDGSAMGTITFAGNYIHECDGTISFRGLSTDRTDVANVYDNVWENIGDNYAVPSQHWAAFEINRTILLNFYNNTITNVALGQWGEGQGLQMWDIDNVDIYDNDFTNCYQGIWIYGGGTYAAPTGSVYHNSFTGFTDYAIAVDAAVTGGTLDAEENYWGTVTIVGVAASVQGDVDNDPWCSDASYSNCTLSSIITDTWADDDWAGSSVGDLVGGHIFGYDAFATIQEAIDAVNGSTVIVLPGTYNETLNITTVGLNLIGVDRATVIIDPTGFATNNAGIYVGADNVTIQTLTLRSTVTISLPRYGIKFGEVDGCTLEDVTVRDVYRSGVDALGTSNLTVNNVSVLDNGGHGLSLVDCNNVAVSNVTLTGNGWQNASVATWGRYTPLGTSGIVFSGTNSFGDLFQLEMGDYNNPGVPPAGDAIITYSTNIGDGADVTVQASDFGFAIHGEQDDSPDQSRIWFMSSLANAALVLSLAPIGHWSGADMYIEDLVDPTQLYVSPGGTIQAAIYAADPGDDINILSGAYAEGPQIHVDRNVSLVGQAPVTITPVGNTGSSGDSRGWFLVDAGVLVNMSDLTLDGAGFDIYQGIRSYGGGTYENVTFQNFVHPGYAGVGLAVFGADNVTINNCTFTNMGRIGALLFGSGLTDSYFTNNTYTGKGAGDWLDYAADISAGAVVTVDNCTITNCTGVALSDGSTSAGLLVTTYFGTGTTANITNCTITGNTTGIAVGYDASDVSTVVANDNVIANNASFGISVTGTTVEVNAENNWWGAFDGPEDASGTSEAVIGGTCYATADILNAVAEGFPGDGLGNAVDDLVDYCPWVATGVTMSPEDIVYLCGGDVIDLDVALNQSITNMKSISIRISYPADLVFSTIVLADANYANAPPFVWDNGSGYDSVQVDMFVQTGFLDGVADLFTVKLSGATDICGGDQISMTRAVWKAGLSNDEITAAPSLPVVISADCADPVVTINGPADGGFYNSIPVLDFDVTENCDIDAVDYQIDSDGWVSIVSAYSGNSYSDAAWSMTTLEFDNLTEDVHCVQFRAVDDFGREGLSGAWCFTKDITAPDPPTAMVAEPGHNKVKVSWTNSASGDAIGVQVQRTGWGNYPTYSTAAPAYPSAYNDGTNVFGGSGSSTTDQVGLNNGTRDIYYYGVFAYDAAGNYSTPAVSAQARSTSYWLGDVADNTFTLGNYDGFVHIGDLTVFASTYWKSTGDAGFILDCDFGPTVGGTDNGTPNSARGIPVPDDSVQFSDLGIFAINYQAVNSTMKAVPLFTERVNDGGPLNLSLDPVIENNYVVYNLSLNNNSNESKIIHVAFEVSENMTFTSHENLIAEDVNGYPIFAKARQSGNRIEYDFALLGQNASIGGSGTIASFRFEMSDESVPEVDFTEGLIFDRNNVEITTELFTSKLELIPNSYELSQNYPNPFNPTTEISYQLPASGKVTLDIFNLLGQKVNTLVNTFQEAGTYHVTWEGRDSNNNRVASGVYLYRVTVNEFTETKKMMLIK